VVEVTAETDDLLAVVILGSVCVGIDTHNCNDQDCKDRDESYPSNRSFDNQCFVGLDCC